MKELSAKEKLFCFLLARTGNGREAAASAGYTIPRHAASKLLEREDIRRETAERQKTMVTNDEVCAGLRRLAFGNVTDALKLLREDELPCDEELEKLDMFCISEIKKNRTGGIEIKFYDRLKALEMLRSVSGASSDESARPFYEALEKGADAIKRGDVVSNSEI